MSITDELIEQIKEEASPEELADALREGAHDYFQTIFQRGFSTAHSEAQEKIEAKDAKITELGEEIAEKEEALSEGKGSDERVEELREEKRQLEESNQRLKAEAEEARQSATQAAKGYRAKSLQEEIVSNLVEKNVDPEYARQVKAPQIRERIDVQTSEREDGSVSYDARFMDAEGAAPLQAQNGSLAEVAAESVRSEIDDKWKRSAADGGGGAQGGSSGSTSNGKYEQARQAGKQAQEEQTGGGVGLDERLGM
jgi:hypothetical protein